MRRRIGIAAALCLGLAALSPGASASAANAGSGSGSGSKRDSATNNTYRKLLDCVTLDGARAHQKALQKIADANGGTRASGTPGFDTSAKYAADVLRKAGYRVTVQDFQYQAFLNLSPAVLTQVAPAGGNLATTAMSYSGSGDVTAAASQPAVSAATGLPTGCDAADWAGFPAGRIAVISRGACTFGIKATNAQAAGAVAVVIYNNAAGELNGTLGEDFALNLPVVAVTQAEGQRLAGLVAGGLTLRVKTETFRGQATTSNVLAESRWGNSDNVVMAGAHLDSVDAGPGIEDNGTGSAAILEVAQAFAKVKPVNKVRFALWGAEEAGLVGSERYVAGLSEADRQKVALYLNFDMIGSPNPVFFVYDGDDSDAVGAGPGPTGSAAIEKTFESYYQQVGRSFKGTDFDGRSDYGPFIAAGIASGGLFTGAEGIKTADEAAIWGGTAGLAYDTCYHQACDTFDNIDLDAYKINVDAVAYAVLGYSYSTQSVNGVPGKPVPGGSSIGPKGKASHGHKGDGRHSVHDDHGSHKAA